MRISRQQHRRKSLCGGLIRHQCAHPDHHQPQSVFGDGWGRRVHFDGERHELPFRSDPAVERCGAPNHVRQRYPAEAPVPANLIASTGSANVTAVNTTGSPSVATAFPITPPTPTITSLSPTSATAGRSVRSDGERNRFPFRSHCILELHRAQHNVRERHSVDGCSAGQLDCEYRQC